jgi:hypothetical protein
MKGNIVGAIGTAFAFKDAFAIVVAFQGQAAFVCQRAVQFDFFTNGGFIFTKCSRDCSFGRTIFNAGKDDTSFFQC